MDLHSKLRDLALDYAGEIVAAVRSASLRELFEPAADAGGQSLGERVSRAAAGWAVTYGLSDAEADVLRRSALGESQSEIARNRQTTLNTIKTLKDRMLRRTRDATLERAAKRLLREIIEPPPGAARATQPVVTEARTMLETRIERLRRLAAKEPDDSTRYAIGVIIKELKRHPETFGESAVSVAAAAIGEDQATLYRFASVAERWNAREVRALLAGEGVSWSHLVALARVHSGTVRSRLLKRVRRERPPLRELQILVDRATK